MAKLAVFTKKYNSFCMLVKRTKILSELYRETSAKIAIVLAVLFSLFLSLLFENNKTNFFDLAGNLISILIPALIGLLGFYIAGLAMLSSLIRKDVVDLLNQRSKIEKLIEVLTCYYFAGAIVLCTIVSFLACYVSLKFDYVACSYLIYFLNLISCYLFFLSICYSVSLLGNCINFFILMNHLRLQIKPEKNCQDIKIVLIKER